MRAWRMFAARALTPELWIQGALFSKGPAFTSTFSRAQARNGDDFDAAARPLRVRVCDGEDGDTAHGRFVLALRL